MIWQELGYIVPPPETTATDTAGIARARWTLGSDLGPVSLAASVLGATPSLVDTFTAAVLPGRGTKVLLVPQGLTQLLPADTLALYATVYDRLGHSLLSPSIQWTSSAPAVATVSRRGLLTALGPGVATIQVRVNGVTGSAVVVVR